MIEKKNVPKLRFPEFTGDWEQHKIGEIAGKTYGGGTPKTSNEDYWGGTIPWIQSSNITDDELFSADIKKHITESGLQKSAAQLVPANSIAVVSHVGVGKLVLMPFEYTTSQDFISLSELNTEPVFTCYALYKRLKDELHIVQGSAIKGITKDTLMDKIISVPSMPEQVLVGGAIRSLDALISLQQRKLDQIKEYKKGMLQKMFPKDGAAVPEVRFPGFTGKWERCKCKDVAPLQRGFDLPVSQMEDGDYPVVMSNGIGGYHSEYKAEGPGIVTGRSGTLGKLHYIEENYWPHNTALWVTDFKGNHPKFIYYMYQKLDLSRFGSGSGVPTLNRNDVHDAYVAIPQVEEQINIADLLTRLDETVTLHQRKLDAMKEYKKGLLQQMFV